MRLEPRIGPEGRDDELTRALRGLQAPPGGEAFWEGLERRILARVAGSRALSTVGRVAPLAVGMAVGAGFDWFTVSALGRAEIGRAHV